jgi:NADH-quinone oxidoreductase subunit G
MAANDPEVNEEWLCDKGRFGFRYAQRPERLTHPLVRGADGELAPASWPEALAAAAAGLSAAHGRTAVLAGGRLTVEDSYAYGKFARVALGTNDVDFRARAHSAEEADFLAAHVAGRGVDLGGSTPLTNRELEQAPTVLLAGLEAEEEAPGVFLRLRKAHRKHKQQAYALAPYTSRGLEKAGGVLLPAAPGTEPEWLDALAGGVGLDEAGRLAAEALRAPGAVILVGERLAAVPGGLTAVLRLSTATGARTAWIPRRAGERGAVEAGVLPGLLPGGRPVTDPRGRDEVARVWGLPDLPTRFGRDTGQILEAAAAGELAALVVGGVDVADLPDPARARAALGNVGFLVSLEQRPSEVTDRADVVLPVAAVAEKSGTFLNWEGRARMFEAAIKPDQATTRHQLPDARVLTMLADAMDVALGLTDVRGARRELDRLAGWSGTHATAPNEVSVPLPRPDSGQAVLAGHRLLLDQGRLQDGDEALAATRHAAVARLSAATAAEVGVRDGEPLTVAGPAGSVTLPVTVTPMPDRVVWVPLNSVGGGVTSDTGARPGQVVSLSAEVQS